MTLQPATLTALFADWAAKYADLPALSRKVDGVFTPITYAELDRRASRLALALARELGVEKGELVALVCNNRLEWMVCSLAIHMLGAVDVPRASDTPPDILAAILGHAQPAVAILENTAQLEKARGSLPRLRAAVLVDAPQGGGAAGRRRVRHLHARRSAGPRRVRLGGRRRGGGRAPPRRRGPRGPRHRHLHVGHHGHAQGRGALARQLPAQHPRDPRS